MIESMRALLTSRKFLVLVMDTIISITLYFSGKYAGASAAEDIQFLIGALQLPALMLIYAIAHEDAAEKGAVAGAKDLPCAARRGSGG
ncbi:MAG: hypothetical protein ACM3JD_02460 [Rudaea sp.]